MEAINQASALNDRGVCLLVSNRPRDAFTALNAALQYLEMAAATAAAMGSNDEEEEEGSSLNPNQGNAGPNNNRQPKKELLRFVPVSSIGLQLQSTLHQSTNDDCSLSICNNAFLFSADIFTQPLSSGLCEMCLAAVCFNLSLTFHDRSERGFQVDKVVALRSAWSCDYRALHRIDACSGKFDCRGLLVAALNNLCVLYYDLGELPQYQLVLTYLRFLVLEFWPVRDEVGLIFNVALLREPFSAGAA